MHWRRPSSFCRSSGATSRWTYEGLHLGVAGVQVKNGPVQPRVPILVGGGGERRPHPPRRHHYLHPRRQRQPPLPWLRHLHLRPGQPPPLRHRLRRLEHLHLHRRQSPCLPYRSRHHHPLRLGHQPQSPRRPGRNGTRSIWGARGLEYSVLPDGTTHVFHTDGLGSVRSVPTLTAKSSRPDNWGAGDPDI
jgi:hypothetical protein